MVDGEVDVMVESDPYPGGESYPQDTIEPSPATNGPLSPVSKKVPVPVIHPLTPEKFRTHRDWILDPPTQTKSCSKVLKMWRGFLKFRDVDKDGRVSLTDYQKIIAEAYTETEKRDKVKNERMKAFKSYDHDKDGFIEKDEYISTVLQKNKKLCYFLGSHILYKK